VRSGSALSRWDQACAERYTLSRGSRRWRLCAVGAHLGDGALWLVVGLVAWFFGGEPLRKRTLYAAPAVAVTAVVATALKYLVRRPRPQDQVGFYSHKADRYSFPSGHAARMAAIASAVGHFDPSAGAIGYLLAILVGLCRIAVGVHYLSDVLVGLLLGTCGACGVIRLIR
jgi:undecaprenyl-diphosphatase